MPDRPQLRYAVHDIPDPDGNLHVFLPGNEIPDWAQEYITNPNCWVGGVAPGTGDDDKPRGRTRKS